MLGMAPVHQVEHTDPQQLIMTSRAANPLLTLLCRHRREVLRTTFLAVGHARCNIRSEVRLPAGLLKDHCLGSVPSDMYFTRSLDTQLL